MWGISVLCVFASLLFVYAGFQSEQVLVRETEPEDLYLSREVVFYVSLAFILIINVLVYVVGAVVANRMTLRAWFYGLIITLNIFSIIALSTLSLTNSGEVYDYSRTGYFIYGSLALIGVWCLVGPVLALFQKNIAKSEN